MATTITKPATLGALRASGYHVLPVRDELRKNLVREFRQDDMSSAAKGSNG